MWSEIAATRAEERMTILLTTHYMEEADVLASELAIIDRGRVVVHGAPEALKSDLRGDASRSSSRTALARGRVRRSRG